MEKNKKISCIVVGDAAVGKTCLLKSYLNNTFIGSDLPTIGMDFYQKETMVDNKVFKFLVWDTSGLERFRTLTASYYHRVEVCIICFSVVNPMSFENVKSTWYRETRDNSYDYFKNVKSKWYPEFRHFYPDIPILLVGTKVDLRNEPYVLNRLKEKNKSPITYDQGVKLCKEIGAIDYMECSAMTQQNLKEIFEEVIRVPFDMRKRESAKLVHKLGDCQLS